MERGTIKSYSRDSGGTIGRIQNTDVGFTVNRLLGNRNDYKAGDRVWFEIESMQGKHVAINIRKMI